MQRRLGGKRSTGVAEHRRPSFCCNTGLSGGTGWSEFKYCCAAIPISLSLSAGEGEGSEVGQVHRKNFYCIHGLADGGAPCWGRGECVRGKTFSVTAEGHDLIQRSLLVITMPYCLLR